MNNKPWQRLRSHGHVCVAMAIVCACAWSPHAPRDDAMLSAALDSPWVSTPLPAHALEETTQTSAPQHSSVDSVAREAATLGASAQTIAAPIDEPRAATLSREAIAPDTVQATAAAPAQPAAAEPLAARLESLRAVLPSTQLAAISAFDVNRTVTRFEVSGASRLSQQVIDDTLKGFLGAERDDDVLNAARDALQRAHNVQGYRVKVVVGKNDQRDGVARLEVRERKLYSMRIAGGMVYDPVLRRNVRAGTVMHSEEPTVDLGFSPKLQG